MPSRTSRAIERSVLRVVYLPHAADDALTRLVLESGTRRDALIWRLLMLGMKQPKRAS